MIENKDIIKTKLIFSILELLANAFVCGVGFEFGKIMLIKLLQ